MALEQVLGAAHLEFALRERGVTTVGPPLVADLLQPRRRDRQPEQLARERRQCRRQALVLEIVE